MITEKDKEMLAQKSISEETFHAQLNRFKIGFPFLQVVATASVEKGIMQISENDKSKYLSIWENYLSQEKKNVAKFVPASGAASRMFKDLYAFLDADYTRPRNDFEKKFFDKISEFAFIKDLNNSCKKNTGKTVNQLLECEDYKKVVENLLSPSGLNYGNLPKGLLKFHAYESEERTPVEEHLREACLYANGDNKEIKIHFTVSPEHKELFEILIKEKYEILEKRFDVNFDVSFSEQKTSTDTLAVTVDDEPFRNKDGDLLFRPGGHGALLQNLNDLDSDVVFVKNIDNISPDKNIDGEATYKKLLAGVLVSVQTQIFGYLKLIDSTKYTHDDLIDMLHFVQNVLNVRHPEVKLLEDAELVLYLKRKLDRPSRVCGMVKNIGEPGGGPFLVMSKDGTIAPQILESSQIDMANPIYKEMFEKGTHFNPVDLVCGLKDYSGHKFNLNDFVDDNTGFISSKSKDGLELKALELPGLWNGAMSDWNTVFIEVPVATFNPVKTVNDLLRLEHQC